MTLNERRTTKIGRQAPPARVTWTPGRLLSGIIGLLLVVMGAVALFRLLPSDFLGTAQVEVLGVGHTVLMAVIAVGFGLLFIAESVYFAPSGMTILGIVALSLGLIAIVEPNAFRESLGVGGTGGWLYTIIGVISIVMGLLGSLYHSGTLRRD